MNRSVKSILSLLLCLSLCLTLAAPVLAAEGGSFTAKLSRDTVVAGTQQIVTLTVETASSDLAAIGAQVVGSSQLELTKIENSQISGLEADSNVSTGAIAWTSAKNEEGTALTSVAGITEIATLTFTVPADVKPGNYQLGLKDIVLSDGSGIALASSGDSAYAALTVLPAEAADVLGYTAGLSTLSLVPTHEDAFTVDVNVSHMAAQGEDQQTVFAAGEMTITYDPAVLTFVKAASTLPSADCITESTAGTLKLADYGSDKSFDNVHYALAFTSTQAGETDITLTAAAFTNKENAATSDLVAATLVNNALKLDIQKKVFDVTLPSEFTGATTVVDGDDYTMTLVDTDHDIESVKAYYADGSEAQVVDNGDGTYTIRNVTGSIAEIKVVKSPKVYQVEFNEADPKGDKVTSATYGVDYSFTLPDDVDAFTANGVRYTLEKITMNGDVFTDYTYDDATRTATIAGDKIKGDLVITIRGNVVELTHYTVTMEGSLSEIDPDYAKTVAKNASYTLSFKHLKGHHYTVTATMGGANLGTLEGILNAETGKYDYTIESVTGTLVFTVTRQFDYSGVSVEKYMTIEANDIWIILKKTVLEENTKPLYDGNDMFWSDRYQAYCYLVISDNFDMAANVSRITLDAGTAPSLNYNMDVNKSGRVDAADAQLVYNMYNAMYAGFTTNVTMEKFLLADVNGKLNDTGSIENLGVDTSDAVAIISAILAGQTSVD